MSRAGRRGKWLSGTFGIWVFRAFGFGGLRTAGLGFDDIGFRIGGVLGFRGFGIILGACRISNDVAFRVYRASQGLGFVGYSGVGFSL